MLAKDPDWRTFLYWGFAAFLTAWVLRGLIAYFQTNELWSNWRQEKFYNNNLRDIIRAQRDKIGELQSDGD